MFNSLAMNNVSSSDVIVTPPSQTQPGLLATAVPHSIPAKPKKVCTLSHSLMTVNVVVCVYFILCDDVITSHVISHQLTVQCRQKKRAPRGMIRGSAATDGRFVYIAPGGSNSLYQYECSTKKWMELIPSCPYEDSGLAIIDSELTTVGGGFRAGRTTNRLFTLRQGKWVEVYPPMKTARSDPAVVSTSDGDYLIAIGGWVSDGVRTATVELFQVKSRRWYKLTDLPQRLLLPSATICGDLLHVIGMDDRNGYSCSLQSLPSNDRPITSPLTLSWKPLPPLPVERSTAATLCGQLVLIGGTQVWSEVKSIHQLVEGQWVEIGSMTSVRYYCLAVSPSPDRILIVGGYGAGAGDSIEECVAV